MVLKRYPPIKFVEHNFVRVVILCNTGTLHIIYEQAQIQVLFITKPLSPNFHRAGLNYLTDADISKILSMALSLCKTISLGSGTDDLGHGYFPSTGAEIYILGRTIPWARQFPHFRCQDIIFRSIYIGKVYKIENMQMPCISSDFEII